MTGKTYKTTLIMFVLIAFWGIGALSAYDCPYQLAGDLNEDCGVNLVDLAIMAQHWLVDCNLTPENPACLPKWQPEPPMSVARDQFTGGVINGKIYVFGGNGNPGGGNLKSTEMFDPNGDWSSRVDNNHNDGEGVEELTGAVVDCKLYVFGAYGGVGPSGFYGDINFNEVYDPVTDTWTSLALKPTLVTGAPSEVYNGEIYLFGGDYCYEGQEEPNVYDVVEAYNPATDSWRQVTNMPNNLFRPAVATVGDKAYVIGGGLLDANRISDEVWTFDFQTEQWDTNSCESLPDNRARGFAYSSAAPTINGKIFLIGGGEGNEENHWPSKKVDIYDTTTNTWHIVPSLPLPLDDHLSLVLDGKIYVIGGCNGYDYLNRAKSEVISLSIQGE
jgi:N-acetylneuraminic acid mutarotase